MNVVYAESAADPYTNTSLFTTLHLIAVLWRIIPSSFKLLTPCRKIYSHTSTPTAIKSYHALILLHQAVAMCKAAEQVSKPPEPLSKKEIMPPGKSLEHQWLKPQNYMYLGEKRMAMHLYICTRTV